MKETEIKHKEPTENVKQTQHEIKKEFFETLYPKPNHTLFEVNVDEQTIEVASFDAPPILKYEDAMKRNVSSAKKLTRKQGCLYISALNKKNVIKILKRDFNIIFENHEQ